MNYDEPGQILVQILMLQQATQLLQKNRTLINGLFNGDTPYTDDEAQEENVSVNVNFLEGTRIASNATNQLNKAFFSNDHLFTVKIDKGPQVIRQHASAVVTKLINKELKRSRLYRSARESANAQVVLHGPGAVVWRNRRSPLPTTAGIEDILIPSGTLCDMSNLDTFAIYRELVWSQLEDAAFGEATDPGWNKGYVQALLATLYNLGFQPIYQGNRWLFPEKLAEDVKEGAWQTYSSSLPKVLAWDFFYRNDDTGEWNRKMVLDYANMAANYPKLKETDSIMQHQQVLYSKDNYAEDWQEIIHWYIGNCSNVAPYRFHSIRSIGYLLYGVVALQNKLRCRLSDHVFQNLLTLFRNVSEDNREKLGLIDLTNFGIVPDGTSFVPPTERHTADWNLVLMQMNQNRQLMSESSSSFLPDMQGALGGEGREMTATETLVRQNTSITLTAAVLAQLGDQSLYEYREICRRFCKKGNPDPVAVRFREQLKKEGLSTELLDFEAWDVIPAVGMGGGNKAAELTGTQALMEMFPLLDPNAQRLILRKRIAAITDNPDEAMAMVPEAPEAGMQDDVQYAQVAFGVLMQLVPFTDKEGVNHVVMAQVLMGLTQQTLQQAQMIVQQPDGLALAAGKVAGAANVLNHVQGEIGKVGQADVMKQAAKQLFKQWEELNQAMMEVAKQVQAAQEQQAQQGNMNPEMAKLQAKLAEIQATGEMQRQIAGQQAQQKMEQRQAQWAQENERRNADTAAEIERGNARTVTELQNSMVKAQADARLAVMKEAAKPKPKPAAKG